MQAMCTGVKNGLSHYQLGRTIRIKFQRWSTYKCVINDPSSSFSIMSLIYCFLCPNLPLFISLYPTALSSSISGRASRVKAKWPPGRRTLDTCIADRYAGRALGALMEREESTNTEARYWIGSRRHSSDVVYSCSEGSKNGNLSILNN